MSIIPYFFRMLKIFPNLKKIIFIKITAVPLQRIFA